jgi:hypothetical protein
MLGLGGAAAVARRQQSAAGGKDDGEAAAPLRDPVQTVPSLPDERLFQ